MAQMDDINSNDEIIDAIGHTEKGVVKGIHIAKMKSPGMMKPRWVVVDTLVDGKQVLYCYEKGGGSATIRA